MRTVYTMGLCLAAVIAATGAGWAQAPASAPAGGRSTNAWVKAMFDRIDTNHDGYISREEAQAARDSLEARCTAARDKAFARLDANGDGSVSRAEFDAAAKAGRGAGAGGGAGCARGAVNIGGGAMLLAMFDRVDADHDGRISLAEAEAAVQQRMAMRAQHRAARPGGAPAAGAGEGHN